MKFIKRLVCRHPRTQCEMYSEVKGLTDEESKFPDTRIIYSSPWSLFGIKETRYLCRKCGKKFWYTRGDFEWQLMNEKFINSLTKDIIKKVD